MMSLELALYQLNSNTLKKYLDLLGGSSKPTRKADRINVICQQLLNPESLRVIWGQLDSISQRAISVAYHNDGVFDATAFAAQYGQLPPRPQISGWSYSREPILFDLFVLDGAIPADLRPLLADFALPVERFQLEGRDIVPTKVKRWDWELDLVIAETELTGRADLLTYLQLVDQGALKWSPKTQELTAASVRKLYTLLMAGDFHPEPEKLTGRYVIRPFGLDKFAQQAGLVTSTGNLTSTGRAYLQNQDTAKFLTAFEKWVEKGKFDELTRITHLNGLNAKGTRLTAPASRREKIIEALSWCPTGQWLLLNDFYRAILIWQFDFEVETTDWSNLYAGPYKEYGYMDSSDYWKIVKGLYINAVLMEYLAVIGAIDIAYVSDDISLIDTDINYVDEALSLHDGLLLFRINAWGAFLLGQADEYVPAQPKKRDLFTIDANLQVRLLTDLLPNEQLLLEAIAVPIKKDSYRLDTEQMLTAVESGQDFDHLVRFLQASHQGDLAQPVADWLAQLQKNIGAFREGETAVVVQLKHPTLLALVEQDAILSKLYQHLDDQTVLVLNKHMGKFRKRLKELGYLLK